MAIPPTGTKAPYGNRSLRAQWHDAFARVAAADELVIIGYSFPPSDLVTRHFLTTSQFDGHVTIVDRNPDAARALDTLTPHAEVETVTGDCAAPDNVERVCGGPVGWSAVSVNGQFRPE